MVVASKEIFIASLKFSSVYVNVLYRADLDRVLITMNRTKKTKKMKKKISHHDSPLVLLKEFLTSFPM